MIARVAAAAWLAALLGGCSSPTPMAGGGFEGETLAITGRVTHGERSLAGAPVSFIDLRTQTCIARTRTGPDGSFRMPLPSKDGGYLEVEAGDSALARRLIESIPDSSLHLEAHAPVLWKAVVVYEDVVVSGASVRILASPDPVVSDADGALSLRRDPGAREWVVVVLPDGTRRDMILPSLADTVLIVPDHQVLLLEDFEDGKPQSPLGRAIGSGWWYANDDSLAGGRSAVVPVGSTTDVTRLFSSIDAFSGSALSAGFVVDNASQIHFAQAGLVLADTLLGNWMDLSTMDSLVFRVKGTGTVRLLFATRTSLEPSYDPVGMWGVDIALPSEWTREVVRRADIQAPAGSRPALLGIPWETDARQCVNLVFSATSSATLQVDQIEIHGPRLVDLLHR